MRRYRFVSAVVSAIAVSALVGGLFGRRLLADDKVSDHYKAFTAALSAVEANYVEKVDSDRLVYSAVRGMLSTLDPHSSFYDPREYALRDLPPEYHAGWPGSLFISPPKNAPTVTLRAAPRWNVKFVQRRAGDSPPSVTLAILEHAPSREVLLLAVTPTYNVEGAECDGVLVLIPVLFDPVSDRYSLHADHGPVVESQMPQFFAQMAANLLTQL